MESKSKGIFMKITNMELFLKYALPCGPAHVKRGNMGEELLNDAINYISSGKEMPKKMENELEKIFFTAVERCSALAKKRKMNEIDALVIRDYFLKGHNKIIEKRCQKKGVEEGFDPILCKTRLGKVIETYKRNADVIIGNEISKYSSVFTNGLKRDDDVIVHYNFIVEVPDKETVNRYFGK